MKYLLHIDTSGDTGCVAIGRDGVLVSRQVNTETRNHAGTINIMIQDALAAGGISLKDLSAVVVCGGPGSYTGLRIGLSAAKGICYALDLPLVMDSKLTLLAYQSFINTDKQFSSYVSLLVAREKEFFISIFDNEFINVLPAQHILESELENVLTNKENIYLITPLLPEALNGKMIENQNIITNTEIDLDLWVSYAFEQYKCNNTVNLSTAEPFYLKQVYTHKSL